MSSDVVIKVSNLSKRYEVYKNPVDRLKQFVFPRLCRYIGFECKSYFQEFWATRDISFEVNKGETVGIIGRNGSGKSTLLQMICGTLNPSDGAVFTKGKIAAILELGAGFNPEFTGRENVYLNASLLGLTKVEIDSHFEDIKNFADIGEFIERPVKTYSSGMVVRLAFSVSICVKPDILIVDEALAVGDEAFQRKCFAKIDEIKNEGATILFCSHSAQTIIQLCDRAILLDGGELIASGAPKILMAQYQRLANSSKEAASEVRSIIQNEILVSQKEFKPSVFNNSEVLRSDVIQNLAEDEDAIFDPDLIINPGISYESQGVVIEKVQIKTFAGKSVNILHSRRKYRISYLAKFNRISCDVAFGFNLSTVTGFEIGGAGTSLDKGSQLELVRAGECISVTFDFECLLNPGTYFLTIGVSGMVENERKFLHRIVDTLQFKVVGKDQKISNGPLNLNPIPIIRPSN